MKIEQGDYLFAIDDDLEGEVIHIDGASITLLCQDDFEHTFMDYELFRKSEEGAEHKKKKFTLESESNAIIVKKQYAYPVVQLTGKKPEVDLHLLELAPKSNFQNDHEALLFQLEYVKSTIETAMRKRIRRVVFIHGMGKGKLRRELRQLLKREYSNVEFFDASYQKYGHGATEINIHQFNLPDLA